jgi:type I restriction enzyme M protein
LFGKLTDQSSEIECLFIERTKQLLKDGGYAGIILPSSMLSNTGIYESAREIILKYFKIVAIAEFGSNTFMATGTNTVTLFLERRNNYEWENIQGIIDSFLINFNDVACNGIEKPFSKYVNHVFEDIKLTDYISLLQKKPNKKIIENELYKDYQKQFDKLKEEEFFKKIIEIEKEKLLYFLLAFPQNILLVKTVSSESKDKNKDEKEFLGYEFSNRRGSEGIKLYKDKDGNFSSKLYDPINNLNPEKANYYIYNHFISKTNLKIPSELSKNIGYVNLLDLMNFGRVEFTKGISTNLVKKKQKIKSKWKIITLSEIAKIQKGSSITQKETTKGSIKVVAGGISFAYHHSKSNRPKNIITVSASGANAGYVNFWKEEIFASDCTTISGATLINTLYIYYFLKYIQEDIYDLARGQAQPHVYPTDLARILIPLPPLDIQEKIVNEIQEVEKKEEKAIEKIKTLKKKIEGIIFNCYQEKDVSFTEIDKISDLIQYGISEQMNTNKIGFKIFRMQEIINRRMYDSGSMKYVDINSEEFNKFKLNKGDILFNRTNSIELVGKTGMFDLEGDYCFASYLVRIVVNRKMALPSFVNLMMNSESFQAEAKNSAIKSVNQANINATKMKSIKIPLPNLQEQKRIVLELEKIESEIKLLEKSIEGSKVEKEKILEKYL